MDDLSTEDWYKLNQYFTLHNVAFEIFESLSPKAREFAMQKITESQKH